MNEAYPTYITLFDFQGHAKIKTIYSSTDSQCVLERLNSSDIDQNPPIFLKHWCINFTVGDKVQLIDFFFISKEIFTLSHLCILCF